MSAWAELLASQRAPLAPPAHVALQRALVRMHFDPEFARRVRDNPRETLSGIPLTEQIQKQLKDADVRAWSADQLRRARGLRNLMEEFKVSSALVLLETGRLESLLRFFGSDEFHECVSDRGYLALAFHAYLSRLIGSGVVSRSELPSVLELEGGMAFARRAFRRARSLQVQSLCRDDDVTGLPFVRAGTLSLAIAAGTLNVIQAIERFLFEASLLPALVLCSDGPRPERLPEVSRDSKEFFLLEAKEGDKVDLNLIPEAYHQLIDALAQPLGRRDFWRTFGDSGRKRDDVVLRLESLTDAGVLFNPSAESRQA